MSNKSFGNWDDLNLRGKTSGSLKTTCPSCENERTNKKDRSVSINLGTGLGRCYRCDTYFVNPNNENTMTEEKDYVLPPQDFQNYTELSDKMVKWVNTRGISQRTLIDNKITEEVTYVHKDGKDMNCITFNYFEKGVLVSKKFRSATKGFAKSKDSKKTFYGIDDISDSEFVVVVEGEFDKLAFWEADVKNVISVPNGAKDVTLFTQTEELEGKKIVIAVDTDDNGKELEGEILKIFGDKNCYKINFPKDCKDANDVLVKHGKIALEKLYKEKIKYSVITAMSHVYDMSKINQKMEDFLQGNIKVGYHVGIEAFDNHFAWKENEFYVLTGKKGSGKTSLFQAMQVMSTISNGLKWAVAFQENDKWSMKLNYMSYVLGEFAKDVLRDNPDKFHAVSKWIDEHFIFLKVSTLKESLDTCSTLIDEGGLKLFGVLLDPVNSFKAGWLTGSSGYDEGVDAGLRLLEFSMNYCTIVLNQHPIMSGQRKEGGVSSYEGEGGYYLNKASFTFVINREKGSNENEVVVDNVRNRHTGGSETDPENPLILNWSPKGIDVYYKDRTLFEKNVIQKLVKRHRPFTYKGIDEDMERIIDSEPTTEVYNPPPPPLQGTENAWDDDNRVDLDDLDENAPF